MKKQHKTRGLFLLCASILLILCACENESHKNNKLPQKVKRIKITVQADTGVRLKEGDTFFYAEKGKKWSEIRLTAEAKIEGYTDSREFSKWTLTDKDGRSLNDVHVFDSDTIVFVNSKPKASVQEPETPPQTGQPPVQQDPPSPPPSSPPPSSPPSGESPGPENPPSPPPAPQPATVLIRVEAADANVIFKDGDKTFKIEKGKTWQDIKETAESFVIGYKTDYAHSKWTIKGRSTQIDTDFPFRKDLTVVVHSKSEKINVTVQAGDEHVKIKAESHIVCKAGTKWKDIQNKVKEKIENYDTGFVFSYWEREKNKSFVIISPEENFTIDENTRIRVFSKPVPAFIAVTLNPGDNYIEGRDPDYDMPSFQGTARTQKDWNGVFVAGRKVKLSPYKIGTYEVSYKIWRDVYEWAIENGYTFAANGIGLKGSSGSGSENEPVTFVSWNNCIVWCNAYTEMTYANTAQCVYRKTEGGEILKNAKNEEECDTSYFDRTKKGFRLPTEAEWEFAARFRSSFSENADRYGSVWFTKLNSASGAELPIGFKGLSLGAGRTWEQLRTETDRVAVYDVWYNGGTRDIEKNPPVRSTAVVGSKAANQAGVFDMSGNVWEWCQDKYAEDVGTGEVENPFGPLVGIKRIWRGGSYTNKTASACSVGRREADEPTYAEDVLGFRLVRTE